MRAQHSTDELEVILTLDTSSSPIKFRADLTRGAALPEGFKAALRDAVDVVRVSYHGDDETTFDALLAELETRGFSFKCVPDTAVSVGVRLDLETGRTETTITPVSVEDAPAPDTELSVRIAEITRQAVVQAIQSDPARLQRALEDDDADAFVGALSHYAIPDDQKRTQVLNYAQQAITRESWRSHHVVIVACAAQIARQAREQDRARAFLRHVVDDPMFAGADRSVLELELANTYAAEERYDPAIQIYESLLESPQALDWENWAWLHHNMGVAMIRSGDASNGLDQIRIAGRIRADGGAAHEPWRTLVTAASATEHHHLRQAVALYDEVARGIAQVEEPWAKRLRGYCLLAAARIWCNDLRNYATALNYLSQLDDTLEGFHEDAEAQATAMMLEVMCHQATGNAEAARHVQCRRKAFLEARPHLISLQLEKLLETCYEMSSASLNLDK